MSWKNELFSRIYTIYKNSIPRKYSQVQNNGYLSECIKLERGVRQGCPLSFPLYCTQNNVFTNIVNKDENIKNFTIFHNNRVVHNNSKFPIKWNIKDYKSLPSISIMAWEWQRDIIITIINLLFIINLLLFILINI